MAESLGKAYVQIIPSAKGIGSSISGELNGEMGQAGTSAGSGLVGSIKKVIAVAAIGKAIGASLSQGGELQQSLGGIETLFKDSADKVKQYAAQSYKTTGLSANEYMQSVTGFSASLLQSLGGDTKKAADISNMAMTDMADNSNKMGTSMQDIQNAYQGFAKQNYTMLDNLKLGYGGTKTEMERLLADAEKITGVKYDINNLSDVYSAIHVIQGKLDITGTTAKEAATTFEGSFNSMKASWKDLLGNMSTGGDVATPLKNLAETATTFVFKNFLPMVGNIVKSIPTMLVTIVQTAIPIVMTEAPKLIRGLIDGMNSALDFGMSDFASNFDEAINVFLTQFLPNLLQTGVTFVQNILQGASSALPQVLSQGVEIIVSLVSGIMQAIPQIVTAMGQVTILMVQALMTNIPVFMQKGAELILKLVDGITQNGPTIVKSILDTMVKLITTITENLPKFLQKGVEIIINLAKGIVQRLPDIMAAIGKILLYILQALAQVLPKILVAGIQIIKTLVSGMLQLLGLAVSAIGKILASILQAIWNIMGRMLQAGGQLVSNIARGISNSVGQVVSSIGNGLGNAYREVTGWFNKFYDAGSNIVHMIGDGIWNAIGYVTDAIGNVAQAIRDYLPFSPAKEGPLRDIHRLNFGGTIADSIDYGRGEVNSAIKSLATDVSEGLNFTSVVGVEEESNASIMRDIATNYSYKTDEPDNDRGDLKNILGQIRYLIELLADRNNMQVVLDTGVLVGEVIDDVDNGLGILKRRRERGE